MASERFQTLPNGAVYDTKTRKIVKAAETPKDDQKHPPIEKKSQLDPIETPKSTKSAKKTKVDDISVAQAHTRIAREILEFNREHKPQKTDPEWIKDRGFWYFDRCIEEGVTPTPQGLVLALGFKLQEQNLLLSGNSGLPFECREIIGEFKQALEMVAEGALVDTKTGVVGRIFDLKNRFGWADNPNIQAEEGQKFGEIKSPEELRKALAKMPNLDLIDEPKAIDIDFEVLEGEN